jgi:hypothetical protein
MRAALGSLALRVRAPAAAAGLRHRVLATTAAGAKPKNMKTFSIYRWDPESGKKPRMQD